MRYFRIIGATIRLVSFFVWALLGALILYLLVRGISAFDREMLGFDGALFAALLGTVYLLVFSILLAIPVGIGAGVYLGVYARGRSRAVLSPLFELLASIPSILIGLFGFALILVLHRWLPSALPALWLAAGSVALLIVPYIIKATEMGIAETPREHKTLAYALGASREQVLVRIQLPAARWHILKGIVLATARAAEDTAVIMLTGAVASFGVPRSMMEPFEALPFYIYTTLSTYSNAKELGSVFVAAMLLVGLAMVWVGLAHWIEKKGRYGTD